ncbi:MAG: tetratricopeptide repeat protein [Acidobacteriota bacterium]
MSADVETAAAAFGKSRDRGLVVLAIGGDATLPDLGGTAVAAPEGSYEPYGGMLRAAFPAATYDEIEAKLPAGALDEPRSSMPRILARAIASRQRPSEEAEIWIVHPAGGLSASSVRLIEELALLGAGLPPLRIVLSLGGADELSAALARVLPPSRLVVAQGGDPAPPGLGRADHAALAERAMEENRPHDAAYHLMRSGEPQRAAEPLVLAASRARTLGDLDVASEALRHAYLCLAADQWHRRIEVLERSAEVLTELKQYEEAISTFEEIASLAQVSGTRESPASLCRIAKVYRSVGKWEQAERVLERAEDIAHPGAPSADAIVVERAELLLGKGEAAAARALCAATARDAVHSVTAWLDLLDARARAEAILGMTSEALATGTELLSEATRIGHTVLRARAHLNLAFTCFARSEVEATREHYRQAIAGFEACGDRVMVSRCLMNLGSLHLEAGRHDQALESLHRAKELMQRDGDLRGFAIALNNVAAVHVARGEMVRAKEMLLDALRIMHDLKEVISEGTLSANAASIAATLGKREEAWAYLARAHEIAASCDLPILKGAAALASAEVSILTGNFKKAISALQGGREALSAAGSDPLEERAIRSLAEISMLDGDPEGARRLAERAYETASRRGDLTRAGQVLARTLAVSEPARAEALARASLASARTDESPAFLAECQHALALALETQGRTAESRGFVVRALEELERFASQLPRGERGRLYGHPMWAPLLRSAAALGRKPRDGS